MGKLTANKSKRQFFQLKKFLPGGVHYNFANAPEELVIAFARGENSRVWDLDGNEYLDMFCKFGALLVGHGNPRYNAALKDYIDRILAVDQCDLEPRVCELFVECIACADMVRFGLSGTESIQNAIRLARAYTQKNRFIRFQGHYHGNADNIMGGKPQSLEYPVPEEIPREFLATKGRANDILAQQSFLLPWNEIAILEQTLQQYGDEIAAVLMEPICINGGGVLPAPGYLPQVRQLCDKYGVLLIFDEVITGFRVGLGGAQEMLGVVPDLAVFGKGLGGGALPVSAIAGKREVMELYSRREVIHAGTFNGYPLGLAAVLATMELLREDPHCYQRMGEKLTQIAQSFVDAAHQVGLPLVIQGVPTALVFHVREEPILRPDLYTPEMRLVDALITEACRDYGILFSSVSRMYSNLLMSDDDVAFFAQRIVEALTSARSSIETLRKSYPGVFG